MHEPLTAREQEILRLIGAGLTNTEIARWLVISQGTVKAHSHNIFRKLAVTSRTQALLRAAELGLLGADAPPADQQTQDTGLIGRGGELTRLSALVDDPRVRLITILGIGGMGKTRLALALAARVKQAFRDGVCFVSLAHMTVADQIAPAIADALGLRLQTQSSEALARDLLTYLQDRHLLLMLDNVEHLLAQADLLSAIIQAAPQVRVVATSRQRLNLSAEVVFVLGGLAFDDTPASEAVRLFLEYSLHSHPDFVPQPHDWAHIHRICQLTQGMPLALILAAGWLNMLTPAQIADELTRSIDILESQLRDVPARQRSMRATITASWARLTQQQQQIFASLSVFRGGFTYAAAQQVTNAALRDLQALVNAALITMAAGRCELHELLRQFAHEVLTQQPALEMAAYERHAACFSGFLHTYFEVLVTGEQPGIMAQVSAELANIHAAWEYAVHHLRLDLLLHAVQPLAVLYHAQSRYLDGIQYFEAAVHRLDSAPSDDQRDRLLAILTSDLGFFYIRLGRLTDAETLLARSHTLFERVGALPLRSTTDPLIGLSLCESIQGRYDAALDIAMRALWAAEANVNRTNQAYACYTLTGILLAVGRYAEAHAYAQRAVLLSEQIRDGWLLSHCLFELGHTVSLLGDERAAVAHYQTSYAIRERFGDLAGMAAALTELAHLARRRADYQAASQLYTRSEGLYQQIHDRGGLAHTQHGLGQVALALGDADACRAHLARALQTAQAIAYMPLLFGILVTVAALRLRVGDTEDALALLACVGQHPAASHATRGEAAKMLASHGLTPPPAMPQADLPAILDAALLSLKSGAAPE